MLQKFFRFVSFGNQYWIASIVYLGLTIVLLGTASGFHIMADDPEDGTCSYEYTYTDETGTHTEIIEGCPSGFMCCSESLTCVEIE